MDLAHRPCCIEAVRTAAMPRQSAKRPSAVIDLTSDDDLPQAPKAKKRARPGPRLPVFDSNVFSTDGPYGQSALSSQSSGPVSSQQFGLPLLSQAASSQATQDPDYLDLTQETEGLARELYGTLGILYYFPPTKGTTLAVLTHLRGQDCWGEIL